MLVKGRGRHRHEEGDWLEVPLARGNAGSAADCDGLTSEKPFRRNTGEDAVADAK